MHCRDAPVCSARFLSAYAGLVEDAGPSSEFQDPTQCFWAQAPTEGPFQSRAWAGLAVPTHLTRGRKLQEALLVGAASTPVAELWLPPCTSSPAHTSSPTCTYSPAVADGLFQLTCWGALLAMGQGSSCNKCSSAWDGQWSRAGWIGLGSGQGMDFQDSQTLVSM